MRKEPYTTAELFKAVYSILKQNGNISDILDYALSARDSKEIRTDEFSVESHLGYGDSEGIYLDLYLHFHAEDEAKTINFGTFKTLETDRESMRIMGKLLADIIVDTEEFVRKNKDDFIWKGAGVSFFYKEGEKYVPVLPSLICPSVERAMEWVKKESYPKSIIKDYAARTENTIIQ